MSSRVPDATHAVEQYEALRREALSAPGSADRGLGLSLFLSRGMTAWLAALIALRPRPCGSARAADAAPLEPMPALAPSVRTDLTLLLADMVLACSVEAPR